MARPKRLHDTNQLTKLVVQVATSEPKYGRTAEPVNDFARACGVKRGKIRAKRVSPDNWRERAQAAARAR